MRRLESELQHLRQERAAFQADLRELRSVHAEVRELVRAVQSLRADLSQARGRTPSPVQPWWSNPHMQPCVSSPVVDDGPLPDLPPPPWPEPDVALARQLGNLELNVAATSNRPVVSEPQQYPFVLPTSRSRPSRNGVPEVGEFPPPPTPQDLRELLTPSEREPLPAHHQTAPVYPSHPLLHYQAEPRLRHVVPSSESVYRGSPPMTSKFTHPVLVSSLIFAYPWRTYSPQMVLSCLSTRS